MNFQKSTLTKVNGGKMSVNGMKNKLWRNYEAVQ